MRRSCGAARRVSDRAPVRPCWRRGIPRSPAACNTCRWISARTLCHLSDADPQAEHRYSRVIRRSNRDTADRATEIRAETASSLNSLRSRHRPSHGLWRQPGNRSREKASDRNRRQTAALGTMHQQRTKQNADRRLANLGAIHVGGRFTTLSTSPFLEQALRELREDNFENSVPQSQLDARLVWLIGIEFGSLQHATFLSCEFLEACPIQSRKTRRGSRRSPAGPSSARHTRSPSAAHDRDRPALRGIEQTACLANRIQKRRPARISDEILGRRRIARQPAQRRRCSAGEADRASRDSTARASPPPRGETDRSEFARGPTSPHRNRVPGPNPGRSSGRKSPSRTRSTARLRDKRTASVRGDRRRLCEQSIVDRFPAAGQVVRAVARRRARRKSSAAPV